MGEGLPVDENSLGYYNYEEARKSKIDGIEKEFYNEWKYQQEIKRLQKATIIWWNKNI